MKSEALQQAIYDRLTEESGLEIDFQTNFATVRTITDGNLMAMLSAAYDPFPAIFTDIPQAADAEDPAYFPFVTIGADVITPFDTKDALGGNALVQVDVWERAASMLDLKEVVDVIDGRLRRQALSISGATHITTELESATFTRDQDGKTKRALLLYRVLWLT